MEKCTLAGSPNWYLSQVLDSSWDNQVAYGAMSNIVIFEPSKSLHPETIYQAHGGKILSLSFAPQGFGNKLLSTSDCGEAYVWNLDSRKVALAYKNPQKSAVYGSWSPRNGNLVVCVDDNGNLLQWKVNSNSTSFKAFREHSFVVIACCPHNEELISTGTKQGLVCVINIKVPGKEYILHKLRGHDSEVVSLSWCPVGENVINPKSKEDCLLLASGAKEKKIFFWRAGQDGLYEAYAETPLAPRIQSGAKQWNCVCWHEPHSVLVSTINGEVLSLNVTKLKSKKSSEKGQSWSLFADSHNRCHVVVKSSPWRLKEGGSGDDWRQKDTVASWVWTFGADRILVGICSDKQIAPIKINTIGGSVHAMTISSIDGTSLAIGAADKSIRVVNLSEPQLKTMQTFSQKVSGKVMSLSWHPSKDGWLAYGTSDGRIGIQFTCTVKPPLLFRPFSKDSIYAMEWGPTLVQIKSSFASPESTEENELKVKPSNYVLYAIGGGRIAAMDPSKPDDFYEQPFKDILKAVHKPESLKLKNKPVGLTDLAWKPDYTLLAIGDEVGSIHLLNRTGGEEIQLVASLKVHSSLIQDLSWHPQCCASDTVDVSPQANWLASASNDINICILDTSTVLDALQGSQDDISLPISNVPCIATLKGHKFRVSKIAWSPHEGGRLLSVSYDHCAQVWDVINRLPVSCFIHHNAPLFTGVWSPFNPSLAITAGQEGIIHVWDVQEQQTKLPVTKSKEGANFLSEAKEANKHAHDTVNGEHIPVKHSTNKKREKALLPLSGPSIQKDESNFAILRCLLHPPKDGKIQFDLDEKEGNVKGLPLHYAFFANQAAMEQYLLMESKSGITKENSFILDVWKGSPKDAIMEAIQSKSLNSYIVSIAPTVSHKMWVETCAAYAEQLKEAGEHSQASAYLLAIHKVEEAIKLLSENGKYRHAVAVARCRLPPESPLIKSLLLDWAQHSAAQGQLCLSAVCYASAGEWAEAARHLVRKKSPDRLLMAAQIMKEKCPEDQAGPFYARECFEVCLSQKDWATAQTILGLYPSMNHLALRLYIHELIYGFKDSFTPGDWLRLGNESSQNSETSDNLSVSISLSVDKVAALQKDLINEVTVSSEESGWLLVNNKVTLAFVLAPTLFPRIMHKFVIDNVTSSEEDLKAAYRYLVQAMSLLYNFHVTNVTDMKKVPMFLQFCMWLAPQGPFHANFLFANSDMPLQSSLRAYLAAGLLLWISHDNLVDANVRSLVFRTIDNLKCDIFSIESLKSFKVEFKLQVLQMKKGNRPLKIKSDREVKENEETPKNEDEEQGGGKDGDVSENMKLLSIDEPEKCTEENVLEAEEMNQLNKWVQEFTEAREKVPNPYLSYSHLAQFLNANNTDDECVELLGKYKKFWEEANQSLLL